jgi:transposase
MNTAVTPEKMLDWWLAGATQAEIAKKVGLSQAAVGRWIARAMYDEFGTRPYQNKTPYQKAALLEQRRQRSSMTLRIVRALWPPK